MQKRKETFLTLKFKLEINFALPSNRRHAVLNDYKLLSHFSKQLLGRDFSSSLEKFYLHDK